MDGQPVVDAEFAGDDEGGVDAVSVNEASVVAVPAPQMLGRMHVHPSMSLRAKARAAPAALVLAERHLLASSRGSQYGFMGVKVAYNTPEHGSERAESTMSFQIDMDGLGPRAPEFHLATWLSGSGRVLHITDTSAECCRRLQGRRVSFTVFSVASILSDRIPGTSAHDCNRKSAPPLHRNAAPSAATWVVPFWSCVVRL